MAPGIAADAQSFGGYRVEQTSGGWELQPLKIQRLFAGALYQQLSS
jgi:hypothetical protein